MEENQSKDSDNNKSIDMELIKEHQKYEFQPITVDNNAKKTSDVGKGVPKLNFEILKK